MIKCKLPKHYGCPKSGVMNCEKCYFSEDLGKLYEVHITHKCIISEKTLSAGGLTIPDAFAYISKKQNVQEYVEAFAENVTTTAYIKEIE